MSSRIEKYCDWDGKIAENIDFGCDTGRSIVLSLCIDDGVSSRGHRKNIFSPDLKKIGIFCGPH